ncbi:MAG TPA: hypothetical protein VNN80_29360, partial [Polyangiaceae bacterium]|nr:hypothetical protein [Polyangiaceae bacterium]
VRLDIATQLRAVWSAAEARIQLRFGPAASNGDAVSDTVAFRRFDDENDSILDLNVVAEPDPDNVARIEVEYFQ